MTLTQKTMFWSGTLVLFSALIWVLGDVLTPFILGTIIAYLLNPVVVRFSAGKIPRFWGALVILLLFFLFITLVLAVTLPMAVKQAQMFIDNFPAYYQSVMDYLRPHMGWVLDRIGGNPLEELGGYLKSSAGKIAGTAGGVLSGLAVGGKVVTGFLTTMILTPLVAFFMMKDWPRIVAWIEDLYPRRHEAVIRDLLEKIDGKVSGFIRGQITVAFVLGVLYAAALTLAGLSYGFLIGFMAGLFSIIPLLGSTLGLVAGIAVAWFQSGDIMYVALIGGIFAAGQFIEGNFLTPKVMGDQVGLHPLWIMLALLVGGSLMGITGMLVAIPVAAAIGVLAGFTLEQYKQSPLYKAQAAVPKPKAKEKS